MDDLAQMVNELSQSINCLRQSIDEEVQRVSLWFDEFLNLPISITVLIKYYKQSDDPTNRQYALVYLAKCLPAFWETLSSEDRLVLFRELLDLLINESVWLNRQNLIDVIRKAMTNEFDDILLKFIDQALKTEQESYLEISLLLATLLPSEENENQDNNVYFKVFFPMIESGFASNQPEIRLAAFHLANYSKVFCRSNLFQDYPNFWTNCVELLDSYIQNSQELHRIIDLYNYAIFENIFIGDPSSLLEKCMNYISSRELQYGETMQIITVVQAICMAFKQAIVQSNFFGQILEMCFTLSSQLFEPDEEYSMTGANFFETIFSEICYSPEPVEALWNFIAQNIESDERKFIFIRSIAVTLNSAPDFYRQKLNDITRLLQLSISSGSSLLRDAAARTALECVQFFIYESDEISLELCPVVYQACQEHVTADLLIIFSRLLDATRKTDDIFETTYPLLMQYIVNETADIKGAALLCLGALSAWSTIKISIYYEDIVRLLVNIIRTTADSIEHLRSPAVDCLVRIIVALSNTISGILPDLVGLFISGIKNEEEDVAFSASCLSAIEQIIELFKKDIELNQLVTPYIEQLLPFIVEYAQKNYIEIYEQSIIDQDEMPYMLFSQSATSLKLLGQLIRENEEVLLQYTDFFFQCCEIHKSTYPFAQRATSRALIYVAEAYASEKREKDPNQKPALQRITLVLLSMISVEGDMGVNFDAFDALAQHIYYNFYPVFLPYLSAITETFLTFLTNEKIQSVRPIETSKDIYTPILDFINYFTYSATTVAVPFIACMIEPFMAFVEKAELRFRAHALRFFSIIVHYIDVDEKNEINITREEMIDFAVQTANEDDYIGFKCLSDVFTNNQQLIVNQYSEQLYPIFLNKMSTKFCKTERHLLLRDACMSLFAYIAMFDSDQSYIRKYDINEFLPVTLNVMPLTLDYDHNEIVMKYYINMYNMARDLYPVQFLHVVTVIFSNPTSIIDMMKLNDMIIIDLIGVLKELVEVIPNCMQIIADFVDNDQHRMGFINNYLSIELPPKHEPEKEPEDESTYQNNNYV